MRKFLLFTFFCFPITAFSQNNFSIQTLAELQESGKLVQGYQYALQYRDQEEGNPDYDFYFGLLAIDTGNVSQGVFALERVLLLDPYNQMARLELARAYFLLEEYERARQEFEDVLEFEPPKNVQANINRYLNAIRSEEGRYRTTAGFYFGLGGGTDSNVNSSNVDSDNIGATPVRSEFGVRDDGFNELSLGFQLDAPFSPGWSFFSNIALESRQHQDFSEVDNGLGQLQAGISLLSKNDRYRFSINGQQFNLDGEKYRNSVGVGLDWRRRLTTQSQLQLFLQSDNLEYADAQENRNAQVLSAGIGYLKEFNATATPLLFTNVYVGSEAADDASFKDIAERDFVGLSLGLSLNLSSSWAFISSIALQNSEYGAEDGLISAVREDNYSSLKLELDWLVDKNWNIRAFASYGENDSNGDIYTYDKTQVGINFRYALDL